MRFALALTALFAGFACSGLMFGRPRRIGNPVAQRSGRRRACWDLDRSGRPPLRGRPTTTSRSPGENGGPTLELRYGCGAGRSSSYIFGRIAHLANFLTTCRGWRTANGTRVGDTQSLAEANEGKGATIADCGDGERSSARAGRPCSSRSSHVRRAGASARRRRAQQRPRLLTPRPHEPDNIEREEPQPTIARSPTLRAMRLSIAWPSGSAASAAPHDVCRPGRRAAPRRRLTRPHGRTPAPRPDAR